MSRSNQDAFAGYRYVVKNGAKDYRSGRFQGPLLVGLIGGQIGVPLPFATGAGGAIPDQCALALATWLFRYLRMRDAMHRSAGFGDPPIDTVARDILMARHRAQDAETPGLPEWDPAVLEQARRWMARAHDLQRIDVKALEEMHSYGPSLRRVWADARSSGGDPWEYIRNWALHIPKAFEHEGSASPNGGLAACLGRAIEWRSTEDHGFPWAAENEGQMYQIRLNDFPDEWMYSLVVDGVAMGDFHDWPAAWVRSKVRGKAKRAARPHAAKEQKTSRRAASDIDPAQLLARYLNGEYEEVWRDLESLGEDVRHTRYLQPARAVARETMRRARRNIETIAGRLDGLNYRFIGPGKEVDRDLRMAKGMSEVVQQQGPNLTADRDTRTLLTALDMVGKLHAIQARLDQPKEPHRPFVPPAAGVARQLKRIERKGIVLPLSLAAWAEEVGSADLTGAHPGLCFVQSEEGFPNLFADPLVVYVPLGDLVEAEEDPAEGIDCPIAPDEEGKAGEPECDFYSVRLPDPRADTTLKVERHNTTFVNYLRLAFRWGGFPGWEQYEERPDKELAVLTDGLLPL